MERRFRQKYNVRFDEVDVFGFVTPAALLRYLQDIAGLDASEVEIIEGGVWVARRTVLEFNAPILPRASLEIETYPLGFTKVTAQRGYSVWPAGAVGQAAAPLVKARTLWVFLDGRGRPQRLPANYYRFWTDTEPRSPQEEAAWPGYPERPAISTTAAVRFSDLDVMQHMNNAAYVELLDNAGWESFKQLDITPDNAQGNPVPLHYDIEYLTSAKAGDLLKVNTWFSPLPGPENNCFERLQQIQRDNTNIIRARSRWQWQIGEGQIQPDLSQLF